MDLQEYLDKRWTREEQLELLELYCNKNNLTSLKGIENLNKLIWFSCSNNNLSSLKGIENLTNLSGLFCYDNKKLTSLKA